MRRAESVVALAAEMTDAKKTPEATLRAGTVALIGRTNVGKSTLLNAALELPLAIVSRKPQTTRSRLLGVVQHAGAEVGLLDTPGLHRAKDRLGKEMNRTARAAAADADVVVFVVALPARAQGEIKPHGGDLQLLEQMPEDLPIVLVINKIDLLKDKSRLLPFIDAYAKHRELAAVVPISALRSDGISRVLDEVAKLLPAGERRHEEDEITDRPMRYFAAEYVREPILAATGQEVPHAVAVTVDEYSESPDGGLVDISVTIHVERTGQKRIIIGDKGKVLKRVGISARQRIEQLLGRQVNLQLWVRVTEGWRDNPGKLADFGLMGRGDGTGR
ncbi:MAG: GTPase Era [Deltaproteobacteria bacterium]|nr:MAG: GTPase Era [Deltaproteobacteria bacterium]